MLRLSLIQNPIIHQSLSSCLPLSSVLLLAASAPLPSALSLSPWLPARPLPSRPTSAPPCPDEAAITPRRPLRSSLPGRTIPDIQWHAELYAQEGNFQTSRCRPGRARLFSGVSRPVQERCRKMGQSSPTRFSPNAFNAAAHVLNKAQWLNCDPLQIREGV